MRQWGETGRAGQTTGDIIRRCVHFAHWTHTAKHTHSEYVILIAFQLQQLLHEFSSLFPVGTLPILF